MSGKSGPPPDPPQGRLLAVGDIHGCRARLDRLIERVRPEEGDRIVFLGDYIDRGPDPRGVIDFLIAFGESHPGAVFLRGNHEEMFEDFLAGRDRLSFLINGGATTLKSYLVAGKLRIPERHRQFFAGLRLFHETERHIFVHAGLRPGIPLGQQSREDLLWIRDEFLRSDYSWGKTVVFGHTPRREPLLEQERLGLDTGAVYGRQLTCCEVETRRCWQA